MVLKTEAPVYGQVYDDGNLGHRWHIVRTPVFLDPATFPAPLAIAAHVQNTWDWNESVDPSVEWAEHDTEDQLSTWKDVEC